MGISAGDGPERLLAAAARLLPQERRDWGVAMLAELAQIQHPSTRWRFALGCMRVALFPPRKEGLRNNTMKNVMSNPKAAAIIGFILALPYLTISSLLMLGIEPPLGPLKPLLNNPDPDKPDPGSFVVLGAFLLSFVALFVTRAPISRTMRAGGSLVAHPLNLILAVVILSFIAIAVVIVIIDQYPCWIGVPNCD
jgi:hypothetical protein